MAKPAGRERRKCEHTGDRPAALGSRTERSRQAHALLPGAVNSLPTARAGDHLQEEARQLGKLDAGHAARGRQQHARPAAGCGAGRRCPGLICGLFCLFCLLCCLLCCLLHAAVRLPQPLRLAPAAAARCRLHGCCSCCRQRRCGCGQLPNSSPTLRLAAPWGCPAAAAASAPASCWRRPPLAPPRRAPPPRRAAAPRTAPAAAPAPSGS